MGCLGPLFQVLSASTPEEGGPEATPFIDLELEEGPDGLSGATLPRRLRRSTVEAFSPVSAAPLRRLATDTCFASRVTSAALPSLQDFSGSTSGVGICLDPWLCATVNNVDVKGNIFRVHASGQEDTLQQGQWLQRSR